MFISGRQLAEEQKDGGKTTRSINLAWIKKQREKAKAKAKGARKR